MSLIPFSYNFHFLPPELQKKALKFIDGLMKQWQKSHKHVDDLPSLKGSVLSYENPLDPIAEDDWEAAQ